MQQHFVRAVVVHGRVRDGHAQAVKDAAAMAEEWAALDWLVEPARHEAVSARFAQQVNDAATLAEVVVGYYHNVSGLS